LTLVFRVLPVMTAAFLQVGVLLVRLVQAVAVRFVVQVFRLEEQQELRLHRRFLLRHLLLFELRLKYRLAQD
jgi:hypothetical protein